MRKLAVVLVKVPFEPMYWPAALTTPMRTDAIPAEASGASSARPVTTILPSVNDVPLTG